MGRVGAGRTKFFELTAGLREDRHFAHLHLISSPWKMWSWTDRAPPVHRLWLLLYSLFPNSYHHPRLAIAIHQKSSMMLSSAIIISVPYYSVQSINSKSAPLFQEIWTQCPGWRRPFCDASVTSTSEMSARCLPVCWSKLCQNLPNLHFSALFWAWLFCFLHETSCQGWLSKGVYFAFENWMQLGRFLSSPLAKDSFIVRC